MATYTRIGPWVNDSSPFLNGTNVTAFENGLKALYDLCTTKGDLIVATAASTIVRQAVGANNTVLMADSAQTNGIKWSNIVNANVDAAAAIAYSKLNLTGSIVSADITDGTIVSGDIADGTIVNADINASAGISYSKLDTTTAWTAYTPALTALTTNPTLGSGSVTSGRYVQIGKLVVACIRVAFGTAGVAAGSSEYRISLPVTASTSVGGDQEIGAGHVYDSSASQVNLITCYLRSSSIFAMLVESGAGITDALPWVWAASDQLNMFVTYEAA